jgi:hypothetical protein
MTYGESISAGFGLIRRNWELVVVQLVMSVVGCAAFFVIVGVPLVVAFIMLGIDIAELARFKDLAETIKDPGELLSRYAGVLAVIIASVLLYFLFVSAVWIFVFGGTLGTIRDLIREPAGRFRTRDFMREGRRLFFPLTVYMSLVGIIFLGAVFLLGVLGGGAAALSEAVGLGDSATGLFLRIFFALSLLLTGLVLVLCYLLVTAQGSISLAFEGTGTVASIRSAVGYFKENPRAVGLYAIALAGYSLVYLMLAFLGYPFKLIPIIGWLFAVPYQIFSYVVQGFLCLSALAAVSYYYRSVISAAISGSSVISGGSTGGSGISSGEDRRQETPPNLSEETQ